jgi:ubiquinone/menaquinone biosynthesis C-methylase UbiE
MDNQFEEILEDYLAKLSIEGKRTSWYENRRKIDFVLGKTGHYLKNRRTVCDIGVGEGYLLRRLRNMGLSPTGIDISRYLIEHLRKSFERESLEIKLIHGDVANVVLDENSFDVVTCLDVLEHIPGDGLKTTIENLKRCIVNGGLLIGTLPLAENLDSNMVLCPKCRHKFHRIGHYHSFDNLEQIRKLFEPDFKIIKIGFVSVPFNLFKFSILNYLCYWLYRLLCSTTDAKGNKTVYFVAKLNKFIV